MKCLTVCFAAFSLASVLAGCASDNAYEDRHRAWWAEQRREDAYERRAAIREHRAWCHDHPSDSSCNGWYRG
jgi:hypothetical protein